MVSENHLNKSSVKGGPSLAEIAQAFRSLRKELALTQVQLAVALELTPTTVYRYEAASGEPSNEVLAKTLQLAVGRQAMASVQTFVDILSQRTGVNFLGDHHLGAITPLQTAINALSLPDRVLVMAMVVMLLEASDTTAKRTVTALLEPWLEQAKNRFY